MKFITHSPLAKSHSPVLKRVIEPDRKIKILITPFAVFLREDLLKSIAEADGGGFPAIVYVACFRSFKTEAEVSSQDQVIKIEAKAVAGTQSQFFIEVGKFKLRRVVYAGAKGIFQVPYIADINENSAF